MLAKADATFLVRQQSRLFAMETIDAEHREAIVRRIELAQADPEACWQAVEDHCRRIAKVDSFTDAQIPEATRLLEPLMRTGERFVPRILEVLQRPQPNADEQHPDEWLIGLMLILAGHLRLEEAAPLIWDRWAVDWDWYNEEVMYSLIRIGTQSVIQLARERYPQSEWYVRNFAHNLLEQIRCEESIDALESLIPGEDDEFLRGQLGIAAAFQFDDRAAGMALRLWNENPQDLERGTIRDFLVAFSHLSGWELPQRDQWERAINAEDDRIRKGLPNPRALLQRLKQASQMKSAFENLDDSPFVDEFPSRSPETIVHSEPRIGRNEPCPCGSGKKYKKCCLNTAARTA